MLKPSSIICAAVIGSLFNLGHMGEAVAQEPPAGWSRLEGLVEVYEDPRFEGVQEDVSPSASIDPVMAQGAGDRASVNRLRTMTGAGLYKPTTTCDTDLVVDGAARPGQSRRDAPDVYVGNLTVLAGGACPASQRNK